MAARPALPTSPLRHPDRTPRPRFRSCHRHLTECRLRLSSPGDGPQTRGGRGAASHPGSQPPCNMAALISPISQARKQRLSPQPGLPDAPTGPLSLPSPLPLIRLLESSLPSFGSQRKSRAGPGVRPHGLQVSSGQVSGSPRGGADPHPRLSPTAQTPPCPDTTLLSPPPWSPSAQEWKDEATDTEYLLCINVLPSIAGHGSHVNSCFENAGAMYLCHPGSRWKLAPACTAVIQVPGR